MESSGEILNKVKTKRNELLTSLEALARSPDDDDDDDDDEKRKTRLGELFGEIEQLKTYVHQHSTTMVRFDIQMCNACLKEIDAKFGSIHRQPNKAKAFKFSFDRKQQASKKVEKKEDQTSTTTTTRSDDQVDSAAFNGQHFPAALKNLSNVDKTLSANETDSNDVIIENVVDSTIRILGCPTSIRLTKLVNCHIFTGPVARSVFIVDCRQCHFQIIAQQLRIHDCVDCDIYQHVTSRSIIENCSRLRFGCYSWTYDTLEADKVRAQIDLGVNNWTQVDDFDCLAGVSPNWSLIQPSST